MVSDGAQYKVSIPVKNQFAVSNIDAPIDPNSAFSSLRPQVFLDGLFVDITPFMDKPNIKSLLEESVSGIRSFYVFSFVDVSGDVAELLEKIWIDRSDLRVARKQVFGKGGRLETDVDYQEYSEETGIAVPRVIAIHRPIEDFSVKMTFTERTLNETVESKVFELARPDGANLVQLTK
jgi:outer membrane lipoprotein-sorting protein